MKTFEKTRLDAEDKGKQAQGAQDEADLRAGQIDKLMQEKAFYLEEAEKYRREQQDLLARADQEEQEEERKEQEKERQRAINIAQAIANSPDNTDQ
jgi:hypothetical protein